MSDPQVRLFGIRHHGPGSARALVAELAAYRPDRALIEGPADATPHLHWLSHEETALPVALIAYRPDKPQRAAFFPFAEFSPEYQAVRYAAQHAVGAEFFDLPQGCMLASDDQLTMPEGRTLHALAQAAGYPGYEQWWNSLVEQRQDQRELFPAVLELMQAARERPRPRAVDTLAPGDLLAERREAHMRTVIRRALADAAARVAVICGAFHGPALTDLADFAAYDAAILAEVPRVPVDYAWVPWTYSRLATFTGYGAGVPSPGWYHHLWEEGRNGAEPASIAASWLGRIGALLRDEGFDISAAHVIEAVRLAEALTALRGHTVPGLPELDDASRTVMVAGQVKPMQLIQRRLVVGERMGRVPADAPMTPLQRDLIVRQEATRLLPRPEKSRLTLDLRVELHHQRSTLLHRLVLLNIPWGVPVTRRTKGRGSYQEQWDLEWKPDLAARAVEASVWGNTVQAAAATFARHQADTAAGLAPLTKLLEAVLVAELPELIAHLMQRIEEESTLHTDVVHLMDALPPLVGILRFGSVRPVDTYSIQHAVDSILTRVALGLPQVCRDVNDAAADDLTKQLEQTHALVGALRQQEHSERWRNALQTIADDEHTNPLLGGRAVRLLFDRGALVRDDVARRLRLALSHEAGVADDLVQSGLWLDGFLRGADQLLLRDRGLWQLVDDWVVELDGGRFLEVLPLLRRAFAAFRHEARGELLARVREPVTPPPEFMAPTFDLVRAERAVPVVADILGVDL